MPFLHSYSEHYSGKCLYSYTNIFQYDIRQQQQACLLFLRHQICSKMAVMKSSCVLILLVLALVAEGKLEGRAMQNTEWGKVANDTIGTFPIDDRIEVPNSPNLYTGSLERNVRVKPSCKENDYIRSQRGRCCTWDWNCLAGAWCQMHLGKGKDCPGICGGFKPGKCGAASVVCNISVAVVVIVSVLFQLQLQ